MLTPSVECIAYVGMDGSFVIVLEAEDLAEVFEVGDSFDGCTEDSESVGGQGPVMLLHSFVLMAYLCTLAKFAVDVSGGASAL